MTLKAARALRDVIREATGWHCTVPLGNGPEGYYPQIITSRPVAFHSVEEWEEYKQADDKREEEREKEDLRDRLRASRRSPLDLLIDRACGLE